MRCTKGPLRRSLLFLITTLVGNGLQPTKKGNAGIYAEFIYNELCGAESIMARDLYGLIFLTRRALTFSISWATAMSRVCRITFQKFFESAISHLSAASFPHIPS